MATDYEWKIEIHPNHQIDIDDIIFNDTIDATNKDLSKISDPCDVCLVRRVYDDNDDLRSTAHYYVDFETMTLEDECGNKPPKKYQKEVLKLNKPRIVFDGNLDPDQDEDENF